MREIFARHTDLIEPLSLDEAYLDVTTNKTGLPTATLVAKTIRRQIREELNLTASAGVSPNKFLAKIASDWKKPDGLFVIQPHEIHNFLLPLPVDHNPVIPNRVRKQISAEDTFQENVPLSECEPHIRRLAEKVWVASRDNVRGARTVGLKLKTKEFDSLTRSMTLPAPVPSCDDLTQVALGLCERIQLGPQQLYRLVGVGLSNFQADADPPSPLFDE